MKKKADSIRIVLGFIAIGILSTRTDAKGVIKGGFYKVENVADHSVLSVTFNGFPKQVITDEWKDGGVQEWKVRSINNMGVIKYIIRNEFVKANEVSKQVLPGLEGHGKIGKWNIIAMEWNLDPVSDKENTFILENASGCLQGNGMGERISVMPCNTNASNQQWHFEFLFNKHQ